MLQISKILLPVDFSERTRQTVRLAVPVAERFDSAILLLYVLPPYHEFGGVELAGAILSDVISARREDAEKRLAELQSAELPGPRVQRLLLEGDPAYEIVQCARQRDVSLIMMPTHGYGTFRRMLLGSVTAKVLHDADCPVWTTTHAEAINVYDLKLRRLLCGIDLTPASVKVLKWCGELAATFGAELSVVHAIAELDPRTESYYFSPEWRKFLVDNAEKEIAELQQKAGTQAKVLLTGGPPAEMICKEAHDIEADLLVIGRADESGLLGRLSGHAYSIIRQSPCPVVSV